jgi:signal transduction histidine kinase
MDWSKWLKRFGIEGGAAVVTVAAITVSEMVARLISLAIGKSMSLDIVILAALIPLLVVAPLAFLVMILLFQLEEADIEIIRKAAQVDYLVKTVSRQNGSEKEQLIRDLNSFAQTVAHDLKTPLTTILGFATMLADRQAQIPPDQQKEALLTIAKTGVKMNNIIQELMLLAAVRQETVRTGPIQMASIVNQAKQRLWSLLLESNAELILPEPATWPKVIGYAPWVEEVWINYISNGIKYGGNPARIELGADPDCCRSSSGHSMTRFWVKDNGRGIAPEDQPKLFTQFTRFDQVRAEGHGLGLSIVARIIEKLGGEVGVESQLGQGSKFYFTLPMIFIEPPTRVRPEGILKRKKI